MPELPEVETIANQLRKQYEGRQIIEVDARPARIYKNVTPTELIETVSGKKLEKISRHGKFMIWQAEDVYPVFHLGMGRIPGALEHRTGDSVGSHRGADEHIATHEFRRGPAPVPQSPAHFAGPP